MHSKLSGPHYTDFTYASLTGMFSGVVSLDVK
jgi:hypothetical protein